MLRLQRLPAKGDDGSYIPVYDIGADALREWRRILEAHGLPLPLRWRDP